MERKVRGSNCSRYLFAALALLILSVLIGVSGCEYDEAPVGGENSSAENAPTSRRACARLFSALRLRR